MRTFAWKSLVIVLGAACCGLAGLAGGCAHESPAFTIPWPGADAALRTLAARGAALKSVRAACGLTLNSVKSGSVTLDGALAVRVVDDHKVWLRLRTWKVAATVFDITVRPDGVWVATSDEATKHDPQGIAALKPEQFSQGWTLFMGGFFDRAGLEVVEDNAAVLTVRRRTDDGTQITAHIEKRTLRPIDYVVKDKDGTMRQMILLSRYAGVGPDKTPLPLRIDATSDEGTIQLRLEDVDVNGELEDAIFTPPPRAVRQP